jgi:hypothetical protein
MTRVFIVLAWAVFFLFTTSSLAWAEDYPIRALSLKALQQRLGSCMPGGSCREELLKLGGLTRIRGYVLDDAGNDLVLFGEVEPESPPLYTEDLAVALRNAWLKYAELKGDVRYYSYPGCSLDPDPILLRRLEEIGDKLFSDSSSGKPESELAKWQTLCTQPQTVSVKGVPFNSHFARVMVDADYYAKRLVDGSASLLLDGFENLVDMTLDSVRQDISKNQPITVPASCLNRFEFCPGENKYKYDDGIVLIDQCPVFLLTEEQYLTTNNEISGRGRPDPLAEKFASDFTRQYPKIARQKPIYRELENLFRFVALAKIMKLNQVDDQVDLDYLLDQAPVSRVKVDQTLPGISQVKELRHRWDFPDRSETLQLWLPSCGGVSMRIEVNPEDRLKEKRGELTALRESITKSRPSGDVLFWDVPR